MKGNARIGWGKGMVCLALSIALSGCMDYTLDTTIRADGTGSRVQRLELTRNSDFELSERDIRALTLTAPGDGWSTRVRVDDEGDTTWVVEKRVEARNLTEWPGITGRPLILGTTPDKADVRMGYVRLGDVAFRSAVQVGVSRRSDGTSLVTYREAFIWDNAADALVEFLVRDLDGMLGERFPRLTEAERGAILGYARSRLWVAGEAGLFFSENEGEAVAKAVAETADHALKIVRLRYPETRVESLRQMMADLLDLDDDQIERLFQRTLPGLNLGLNTSIKVRLTLPGRVTATNASARDGNVLTWEVNPLDNLSGPVEVFAEAVVGG